MIPRMPNRLYAYFRDDQIVFLMSHPQPELTEEELKTWRDAIQPNLREAVIDWPPQWFSFRALESNEYEPSEGKFNFTRAYTLVFCNMKNVPPDPRDFLHFISELSSTEAGLIGNEFGGLKTEEISLNWLASSASQSGGTGGPGSWPVPYRGNPSRAPYQFHNLISKLMEQGIYGDGEGVDVAILDTAPCPHDLVAAYKECKSWHPLINTLLGPNGKLKVYPATYEENLRMGSTSLNKHDYKMTDHGLFSAGIIHSIVPKATIHLIEVLSPLGVGDIQSIAEGFQKVFNDIYKPGGKLVINCSWMLDLPKDDGHLQALSSSDPESAFEQELLQMIANDAIQALALRYKCDWFGAIGCPVIAAAGNDRKGNNSNPPATRFPAAFLSTIGVGALPKDAIPDSTTNKFSTSSYSNRADVPDQPDVPKIVTLGGEEGEGHGVLGLYLGEFPGCEYMENCTKWAWWAGTSFATPILTASVAAVLSSQVGPLKAEAAFQTLFGNPHIVNLDATVAGEDVMKTMQDY